MVVSVNHAIDHMRHALGGRGLSTELDELGILNQAGEHLYSMHPWHWATGRSKLIDLRGVVSGTTATWTESTLTLTSTGSFANYTFVENDIIEIEAGTGVTTGFYEITSRTDDDNIVLAQSISSAGVDLATGDIEFNMQLNSAALPDDFMAVISISATDALLYGVRLTSLENILQNRTSQIEVTTSWNYMAAVNYGGSPPVPILEIWPNPTANQSGVFSIFYRSRWTRLSSDSVNVDVPEFMDNLFLRIVRAFAQGYEREDKMSMEDRLNAIQLSAEFRAAARSDGNIQPYWGRLRGGGPERHSRHFGANKFCYIANTIGAPSA